jgi:hypothetical protein
LAETRLAKTRFIASLQSTPPYRGLAKRKDTIGEDAIGKDAIYRVSTTACTGVMSPIQIKKGASQKPHPLLGVASRYAEQGICHSQSIFPYMFFGHKTIACNDKISLSRQTRIVSGYALPMTTV